MSKNEKVKVKEILAEEVFNPIVMVSLEAKIGNTIIKTALHLVDANSMVATKLKLNYLIKTLLTTAAEAGYNVIPSIKLIYSKTIDGGREIFNAGPIYTPLNYPDDDVSYFSNIVESLETLIFIAITERAKKDNNKDNE